MRVAMEDGLAVGTSIFSKHQKIPFVGDKAAVLCMPSVPAKKASTKIGYVHYSRRSSKKYQTKSEKKKKRRRDGRSCLSYVHFHGIILMPNTRMWINWARGNTARFEVYCSRPSLSVILKGEKKAYRTTVPRWHVIPLPVSFHNDKSTCASRSDWKMKTKEKRQNHNSNRLVFPIWETEERRNLACCRKRPLFVKLLEIDLSVKQNPEERHRFCASCYRIVRGW